MMISDRIDNDEDDRAKLGTVVSSCSLDGFHSLRGT